MAIQKVNTDGILSAASSLSLCNANMNDAFAVLRSAGHTMENSWNSRAGSAAASLMYQLFNGNEARSAVLQNYVNLLQQAVAPGYVESESVNTKLSDQFL
ncbi:MAG: hypothetical protein IJN10_02680 [Firmicutes bacterium]|nr:hypothetical protein [Bacillota bacterium]